MKIPDSNRVLKGDNQDKLEWEDGLETREDVLMELACKLNFDCKNEVRVLEHYTFMRPDELEFSKNYARSMQNAKKWDLYE